MSRRNSNIHSSYPTHTILSNVYWDDKYKKFVKDQIEKGTPAFINFVRINKISNDLSIDEKVKELEKRVEKLSKQSHWGGKSNKKRNSSKSKKRRTMKSKKRRTMKRK